MRAIPPSPSVDSAAVLREAVAAQTRRRIRDALLLVLLIIFAWVSLPTVILWAVVVGIATALQALGAGLTRLVRRGGAQLPATNAGLTRRTFAVLVIVALFALDLLLSPAMLLLLSSNINAQGSFATPSLLPDTTWRTLPISRRGYGQCSADATRFLGAPVSWYQIAMVPRRVYASSRLTPRRTPIFKAPIPSDTSTSWIGH